MAEGTTDDSESPPPASSGSLKLVDLEAWLPPMDAEVQAMLEGYYGVEYFAKIRSMLTKAPRHTCLRLNRLMLADMETALQEVNESLSDYFQKLDGAVASGDEDKAVGRARPFSRSPLCEDTIIVPSVTLPLRSLSQPFPSDQDRVIVVGRLCGEAVLRGADVFSAGVMFTTGSIPNGSEVTLLMDLDMQEGQGKDKCCRGADFKEYQGPAAFIGRGIARMSRVEMFREKTGLAVQVVERLGCEAPPINRLMTGRVYAQNLPSVVVGHVVNPRPGESIIDLCAGPGGKTSHLASLMQNNGLLVSCDRSRRKVLEIKALCASSGATCAVPLVFDSTHAVVPKDKAPDRHLPECQPAALLSAASTDQDGLKVGVKAFYPETFDQVLLDPPCSALGLRPRFAVQATMKDLTGAASFQKVLLWSAVYLLRPGGHLVYSTCTISPLENEAMVRHALDTYPCLRLMPAEPRVGAPGVSGAGLSEEERALVQRFDPACPDLDTTGFFCAKFVKIASLYDDDHDEQQQQPDAEASAEA